MNGRSYKQFCALAYALDAVGERWTLLIIRELLVGPRRFKDLIDGLPGISTNLLSERLKSLEQQGILCRRVLPPPAGSTVYQLTPLGMALEKAVLELGRWGSHLLPNSLEDVAMPSIGATALAIKAFFHPEQARGVHETYELHIDNEIIQVQFEEGEIQVQQGQALEADLVFYTDMRTWMGLFSGRLKPEEAIKAGLIQIEGDETFIDRITGGLSALKRFLSLSGVPNPV